MVRFFLTGPPRSGTTVIAGSLIGHPAILFYGELLNDVDVVRQREAARITLGAGWQIGAAPNRPIRPCGPQEDGYDYLRQFYEGPVTAAALGFKLLCDQAATGPNATAWRYLADHAELRIVRTRRDNLLDVVCSYVRARITRRWHDAGSGAGDSPRFVLPAHECEALFRRFAHTPPALAGIERTHRVLEVAFTDLERDFGAVMAEVFAFLGVDAPAAEKPRLRRIRQLSPAEEIVNYGELKAHFAPTPWARYFDV